MDAKELVRVQQGVPLAELRQRKRRGKTEQASLPKIAGAGAITEAAASDLAAATLTGPFLSAGSLTPAERQRLLNGLESIIEGLYTHLPLKRARYAFDPVQRLRILRNQAEQLGDDAFHFELANLTTALRDAHTRYAGPAALDGKVAALPFLVEMIGGEDDPSYLVSKVGSGLDPAFQPGVLIEYWNGVPIDIAVMRHGDNEVGGRPDSRRAWATQSLTFRSLRYGPPPDEHWVIVGYRQTTATGEATGPTREIKLPWKVVDPGQIAMADSPVDGHSAAARRQHLKLGLDPAAADVRRAKMLLFAPSALRGAQAAAAPGPSTAPPANQAAGQQIETTLTETLKATTVDGPGGPYGHLRIFGFDTEPDAFITELQRLLPLLPQAGLIIDIRGNPGGYILAAELALQLFTYKPIEPVRFSVLATPFTRDMAAVGSLADELAAWRDSLVQAVRNGELYSQPRPISEPAACNALGQHYSGPVVLVADSTTYSSGDLFSAGFVDNGLGPFICVGEATGAGGANVWDYNGMRPFLQGSPIALPALPDGINLTFSFRRATRAGPSEGLPIEDVGVGGGERYALTRKDLLEGNVDLLKHCIQRLRDQPASALSFQHNTGSRTLTITTRALSKLDVCFDGHPFSSTALNAAAGGAGVNTQVNYPAGTKLIELAGFRDQAVCQRRRITIGA